MLISRRVIQRLVLGSFLTATMVLPNQIYAGTIPPGQSPGGSIAPGNGNNSVSNDANPAPDSKTDANGNGASTEAGNDTTVKPGADNKPAAEGETITLAAQNVKITIEALPGDVTVPGANVSDLVQVQISSEFILRNTQKTDQTTVVQLPLSDLSGLKDGKGQLMEAQDYVVSVDGQVISPTITEQTNPLGSSEPPVKWVQFPITLTAGQTAVVSTTYMAPAAGALPLAQFNYALETAAAWQGKLGQSTVTVELPYAVNRQNVMTGDKETTSGARLSGNTVVWSRRNFEPSADDNLKLLVLAPQVWTNIENARAAVKQAPNDVEAQLSLARAYKGALLLDNGVAQGSTAQFVKLADEAYLKAIKANPDSADVRAEYAKFQADTQVAAALNTRKAVPVLEGILNQIEATLKIDPKNTIALGLLANIKQLVTDASQRNPSAATTKLAKRVDGVVAAVGLTSPEALATAAAAITPTVAAGTTTGVTDTTVMTDGAAAISGTNTSDVSGTTTLTPTVDSAAAITDTAAVSTKAAAGTQNPISRLSNLPQTILTVACGALIIVGIVAAALILVFRRQNRDTKQ